MSEKPLTVTCKKKRKKKTAWDLNKLHAKLLDVIEKNTAVYKLNPAMRVFWEVVHRSGELVEEQIRILRKRTGEAINYYSYWKLRRRLEKELRR